MKRTELLKYNPIALIRERENRRRLTNKNISILSSNCIGGILYHEYRLPFLSPTINTRISSNEFIKLIINWKDYCKCKIEPLPSEEAFPMGLLGDITIRFVHYHSFDESVSAWDRRLSRINYDNVFVLLNDCDGIEKEDIIKIQEKSTFQNICVFTASDYRLKSAFYLPCFNGSECVGNTMKKSLVDGRMVVEKYFDFVGWFNQEKGAGLESYRLRKK